VLCGLAKKISRETRDDRRELDCVWNARFAVCGSCCKVELREVGVAAVRVRRVELRLDSERYESERRVCVTCSAKWSFAS